MASTAECMARIKDAAGGELSDDLIDDLIEALDNVRRRQIAEGGLDTLEQALFKKAGEIAEDVNLAATIEKRNRLINIVKETSLMDLVQRADDARGDPSLGLEAATVGVNSPFTGGRLSVDAQAEGIRNKTMGGVVHDLKKAGLNGVFNSKALDREISAELWDLSLSRPTGNATTSTQAKQIAKILHKYRRALVQQENRAGAYIRFRNGYVVRQTHNRLRMTRAGLDEWARTIRDKLDWDAMDVAPEDREGFLKSAYGALVTGVRKDAPGAEESDLMFAFKGPGNLAKKASESRVLLFKSSGDWFDYNQQFGMGSLAESFVSDVGRAANNIALMNVFGTNPRAMFDKVLDKAKVKYGRGATADPAKVKRLDREFLKHYMDEVDGTANIPSKQGLATFGRGMRAIISASKLGGAVVSAVTDLAFVAAERRYNGRSLLGSFMDSVAAPARGMTSKQVKEYGDLLGVGLNGATGATLQRFSTQDDVPGRISKAMAFFFRLNLLTPWTDGVQRGFADMMARDFALNANKALGALDPNMQRMLGMYGFNERKWEVARAAVVDVGDGVSLMLPGAVDDVTGAVFNGLSKRQQQALKDEVSVALAAMYSDRASFASPTPGARERAMTRLGTKPGTPIGEAARFMMQFKSFPLTIMSKIQGRDLYGKGARTWKDAMFKGEGDMLGMSVAIAHATVLGYFALQAKEMLKGRTPRDGHGPELFIASMLQGGGMGIYGDFLLGEANRFGGSAIDTIAGPFAGSLFGRGGVIEIWQGMLHGTINGETPDTWAKVQKLFTSNLPGANLFYTKAALDYLILYQLQEWANPGYLRRVERRMKKENNQSFLIPPSSTMPRGGWGRIFEGVR